MHQTAHSVCARDKCAFVKRTLHGWGSTPYVSNIWAFWRKLSSDVSGVWPLRGKVKQEAAQLKSTLRVKSLIHKSEILSWILDSITKKKYVEWTQDLWLNANTSVIFLLVRWVAKRSFQFDWDRTNDKPLTLNPFWRCIIMVMARHKKKRWTPYWTQCCVENLKAAFFWDVLILQVKHWFKQKACLQSCDSDDVQNSDGGQGVKSSSGRENSWSHWMFLDPSWNKLWVQQDADFPGFYDDLGLWHLYWNLYILFLIFLLH